MALSGARSRWGGETRGRLCGIEIAPGTGTGYCSMFSRSSMQLVQARSRSATVCPGSPQVACALQFLSRRSDEVGGTPDARHGVVGPERQPVDPGHGERSWSVHRCVPGSITGRGDRAWMSLHPLTATVVQMGSGGTVVASRGRQRSVVAAAMPPFFQPTGDVMRPMEMFGSTMAMAPAPRHHRRYRVRQ